MGLMMPDGELPNEIPDDAIVILTDEDYWFLTFYSQGYISREVFEQRYRDDDGHIRVPFDIELEANDG
jgi:hypothetical protein